MPYLVAYFDSRFYSCDGQPKKCSREVKKGFDTRFDTKDATTNATVDDTNDIPRKSEETYNATRD
jgi:hypothetical protein